MTSRMPQSPLSAPKAPSFGQSSGQMVNYKAPATNKASLLAGLTQAGKYKPQTGTATGNQAAQDYAKSMAYQSTADAGRSVSMKNAESMSQRMQANEQLYEANRSNQLAGYRQAVQQAMGNADLANQMAMWRNDMSANWKNFSLGLLS